MKGGGEGEEAQQAIVGGPSRAPHIKKRALKNKALAVSFNDKDLRDFVGGFHKRKKKRRKEAQQQLREKERLVRIEKRKKRKQERLYVQGGNVQGGTGPEPDENSIDVEQDEDGEVEPDVPLIAPVDETKTYDAGDLTIMVKTSEISREEDTKTPSVPRPGAEAAKKPNLPVNKKQAFKKPTKRGSRPKQQKKREKRKGKVKREIR